MKLIVLNDNTAGKKCSAEFGLSFFIKAEKNILFDVGSSDVFIRNSKILEVDLKSADYMVLSHGHLDHGNGLKFIKNKALICHPSCFLKRYYKKDGLYFGLPFSLTQAKKRFKLKLSERPYEITKNIIFLGEIPRKNNFESQKTDFYCENKKDDFLPDDSALAVKSEKGLIVVTGCSHSGICNIVEYAKKVAGIKKIYSVIGGFHLKKDDIVLKKTMEYFKKENIKRLYPCHCTGLPALAKFYAEFKIKQIHSGDIIDF